MDLATANVTIGGDVQVDVSAFRDASSNARDALVDSDDKIILSTQSNISTTRTWNLDSSTDSVATNVNVNLDSTDSITIHPAWESASFAQLNDTGTTSSLNVEKFSNHTFQLVTANISTNAIVRAEGSLDDSNWFNMSDDNSDTTLTTDGTYCMYKANFKTKYIRVNFVSESGATNTTIDVDYMGGN